MTAASGNPEELAAIAEEVLEDHAPPPPPPPPPPPGGDDAEVLIGVIGDAINDPGALGSLTEGEIAAVLELGFGIAADYRGPHWEMPAESKSARRIARYVKESIARHGKLPAWLERWFPDIMAALLLGYEIWRRVEVDKVKRPPAKPAEPASSPLAPEPEPQGKPGGVDRWAGYDAPPATAVALVER